MSWLPVVCIVILLICVVPTQAADFIISYWCGPPPDGDQFAKYAEVAECNFNYCLPGSSDPKQNKTILDACEKHGLKYIVGDGRILAKNPGDPDFEKNLDAVIADYAAHPAMAGYFITDEPNSAQFAKLAAINQYLLKKDSKHLPYINLFPNYASEEQLGNKTYEDHVKQFVKAVKPAILSYDHYIMMATDPNKPEHEGSYFTNMEIVRREGLKAGIPSCFILLVVPHWSYRNPTDADLRWQVNTALAYGYKAIMYFTYWAPGDPFNHAIIDDKGERTEHFAQVRRINGELLTLGPTLMKLTSTGVYHTGEIPGGCEEIPRDLAVQVTSDMPVVLGMFKHEDGSAWAMVVNRHLRKPASVTLKLASSIKGVQEMSRKTGLLRDLKVENGCATLSLRAGDAALLKLIH